MPSANTQALIDAAAERDAELARRVARATLEQQHGARISQLKAVVDDFIISDRAFLQLSGGLNHFDTIMQSVCAHAVMQVWRHGREDFSMNMQAQKACTTLPPRLFPLYSQHF
jgi:hypothetical protein